MRIIFSLIAVLFLAVCGTTEESVVVEKEVISEVSNDAFTLKLISEQATYKVGEPLKIRAELTYRGVEPITIGLVVLGFI